MGCVPTNLTVKSNIHVCLHYIPSSHGSWERCLAWKPRAVLKNQWDFQGPPIMGPPYGKLTIRGSHYWGSLESPLKR